jgi:hypothetical protein
MTRGRENPACSITETSKRADSVRMLHSHHSPGTRPRPEGPRFTERVVPEVENPNSVVNVKDLQTGEEIIIAFKTVQQ